MATAHQVIAQVANGDVVALAGRTAQALVAILRMLRAIVGVNALLRDVGCLAQSTIVSVIAKGGVAGRLGRRNCLLLGLNRTGGAVDESRLGDIVAIDAAANYMSGSIHVC